VNPARRGWVAALAASLLVAGLGTGFVASADADISLQSAYERTRAVIKRICTKSVAARYCKYYAVNNCRADGGGRVRCQSWAYMNKRGKYTCTMPVTWETPHNPTLGKVNCDRKGWKWGPYDGGLYYPV